MRGDERVKVDGTSFSRSFILESSGLTPEAIHSPGIERGDKTRPVDFSLKVRKLPPTLPSLEALFEGARFRGQRRRPQPASGEA